MRSDTTVHPRLFGTRDASRHGIDTAAVAQVSGSNADLQPQGFDLAGLLTGEAFPHAVTGIEVRETHTSWVILTGSYAYKIKKALKLDFIDTSTLANRRHYCDEELRLNRRLAPDLYVDVVGIVSENGRLRIGGEGTPVEYAVRMKQFAARDELRWLIENNEVVLEDATALAERLARFHLSAPVAALSNHDEITQRLYVNVLGNLADLSARLAPLSRGALQRLTGWTHEQAHALEGAFRLREQSGHIRECHGDLHVANIVRSDNRLVPFDCLEFNPQLRWIDVISDLAFLVMDLEDHYRADLAFALLSRYLEVTGDYEGVQLLRFYAVYRALVRAKVDVLSAHQAPARAAEFYDRLQKRISTAEHWMNARRGTLILMHGPSGSGKSWLSERLVPAVHAIRVRSDLERKRLSGVSPEQSAAARVGQGIYCSEVSHRTYGRLAECAEDCLQAGFNVVVDASFLDPADRELFRMLAARLRAPFAIVSCEADPMTLAAHVLDRSRERNGTSDADLAVLDAQLRNVQPFTKEENPYVIQIDTAAPDAVRRAAAAVMLLSEA